jgi:hypothetical protein
VWSRSKHPDPSHKPNWYRLIRAIRSSLNPTLHVPDPIEPVPTNYKVPRVEPLVCFDSNCFKSISNYLKLAKTISFKP